MGYINVHYLRSAFVSLVINLHSVILPHVFRLSQHRHQHHYHAYSDFFYLYASHCRDIDPSVLVYSYPALDHTCKPFSPTPDDVGRHNARTTHPFHVHFPVTSYPELDSYLLIIPPPPLPSWSVPRSPHDPPCHSTPTS